MSSLSGVLRNQTLETYRNSTEISFICCRRVMFVDGKPIPFSVNTTISYSSDDKQNGSLYNKVRVSTVDISRSRQTDVLEIGSTALVEKGV